MELNITQVEAAVKLWGSVDRAWREMYRDVISRAAFRAYVRSGLL